MVFVLASLLDIGDHPTKSFQFNIESLRYNSIKPV